MELGTVDLIHFKILGEALAVGLLVGIERYKGRAPGESGFAGVRTFAVLSLLGAVCGLVGEPLLTLVTFVGFAALVAIGYFRATERSLGLTTELAALVVFWLGYLLHGHEILVISTTIVLTMLLAAKQALHGFVRQTMTEVELFDTLKFLAVVLVVYPLLPDRTLGPYGFFNPARAWLLVVLVSTISYAGYLLTRWLGKGRGLAATALLGGVVSTTAASMSLAADARATPEASGRLGAIAVLANAVQGPRLLLLLLAVHRPLASFFSLPLLAMGLAGAIAAWLAHRRWRRDRDGELELPLRNPYSLTPALRFGLLFVAILFVVRMAEARLGAVGVYLASGLGGFASSSAVALSVAEAVRQGSLPITSGAEAILLGIATNALAKFGLAWAQGNRRFALWLLAGLAVMVVTGWVLVLLLPLAA